MKKQVILLFHLSYWVFYLVMLLMVFFAIQVAHFTPQRISYVLSVGCSFVLLPSILGFYSSYYFLFKTYLQQRSLSSLLGYSLGVIILIAVICSTTITLIFGQDFMFKNGYESFSSEVMIISIIGLINGGIGFILKGFISWYTDLQVRERLQESTHLMELELIKSKLDPHFLFNTLNTIDGLMIKDIAIASDYLEKLSSILRFMLYESKEEKIPLTKELEYIQKYIDLQKIRTTNADFVSYTVIGQEHKHQIPAMLFIPFIENAFKHVSSKKQFHSITISILIEIDKIIFECKNIFNPSKKIEKENIGVGNELIRKRLQLVYPNRHRLETTTNDGIYSIQLTIMAHEN